MTDDEWLACDSPARMRNEIRSRPFGGSRWVLFDLACVARVRDLLGPLARKAVDEVDNWADSPTLHQVHIYSARLDPVREESRGLWRRSAGPLREARSAAVRAVLSLGSHTLATSEMVCVAAGRRAGQPGLAEAVRAERKVHADLMRCVFRSTLSPVTFSPEWRTSTVVAMAAQMRLLRDYSAMPIMADALQEAGCEDASILQHCRCGGTHAGAGSSSCYTVDRAARRTQDFRLLPSLSLLTAVRQCKLRNWATEPL